VSTAQSCCAVMPDGMLGALRGSVTSLGVAGVVALGVLTRGVLDALVAAGALGAQLVPLEPHAASAKAVETVAMNRATRLVLSTYLS
jgi:hypothetical protein